MMPSVEDFELNFKSEKWNTAAQDICRRHKIPFSTLQRAAQGEHIVFLIDDKFVLKIYKPVRNCFRREKAALESAETSLKIAEIVAVGEFEGFDYLVTTQLKGKLMTREMWLKLDKREQIAILSQLAEGLKNLHSGTVSGKVLGEFIERERKLYFARQVAGNVNSAVLGALPEYVEINLKLLPKLTEAHFLHGDVHFGNLRLLQENGRWQISGLFDFADSFYGFREYDFVAVGVLMIQGQGELQREFFRAYGYTDSEINETLRKRLMLLTIFYECSDLRRYALRLKPEAVDFTLDELERAIWNFVV